MVPPRPPGRSAAPEFAHIPGSLAPAPGQVGSLSEQMVRSLLPRAADRRREKPLTRAEVEQFVLAAVESVLSAHRDRGAA